MKQIDCHLNCKATAELHNSVNEDLLQEDKSLAQILVEEKDVSQDKDKSE